MQVLAVDCCRARMTSLAKTRKKRMTKRRKTMKRLRAMVTRRRTRERASMRKSQRMRKILITMSPRSITIVET